MPFDYVVPEPSFGKIGDLLFSNVINARYIDRAIIDPNTPVLRWMQSEARMAERIALREFERRGGIDFANGNLPAIQQLVAVVALDQCGTFSAMWGDLSQTVNADNWNWPRWAAFCYYVSGLTPEEYQNLLGLIVGGYCDKWGGLAYSPSVGVAWNPFDPSDGYEIATDPWYQGTYFYQLPEAGPYDFLGAPYGYPPGYVPAPAYALPPSGAAEPPIPGDLPPVPGDLPSGELPPVPGELPPGEQPPPLPPGEPPAIDPVIVVKDEKKTSDTTILLGVLGGVAVVGLGAWALTRRKENPVAYKATYPKVSLAERKLVRDLRRRAKDGNFRGLTELCDLALAGDERSMFHAVRFAKGGYDLRAY